MKTALTLSLSVLLLILAIASQHYFGELSYWLLVGCGSFVILVSEMIRQRERLAKVPFWNRVVIGVSIFTIIPLVALLIATALKGMSHY